MSNDGSETERHAGIDMVPVGECLELNSGPDDGYPILRTDFKLKLKMSNPVAEPLHAD